MAILDDTLTNNMLEDKKLVCELSNQNDKPTVYQITTLTSDIKKAGTSANVYIQVNSNKQKIKVLYNLYFLTTWIVFIFI